MNKKEAKKRIEKLKKVINYHRYLYHVLDKQELSDASFDSLKHQLKEIEEEYPELVTPDSPTQRVGGEPLEKFEKRRHYTPMLSIEDIFEREELEKWEEYLKRLEPGINLEYFCELKIDGFAISLIYEKGILVQATTRGNGLIGEDVTQNVKTINSIPLKLQIYKPLKDKKLQQSLERAINSGRMEIRGEIYMEKASFKEINQARKKQNKPEYANPRNLAAGSIRQLNPKLAASRNLKFLAYDMPSDMVTDMDIKTHQDKHIILMSLGFKTEKGKACSNTEEVISFWKRADKHRDALPFQVDGVVISLNNNALFYKLGVAGKSPRAVRAFKFLAKQAVSQIQDIKVQVGRTGAITPVAILKPVKIEGSLISRATLHNQEQIQRLGVKIGDTVIIEKAGDVIPAVNKVIFELRTGKEKNFSFPTKCPVCETRLVKAKGEAIWRCPNPDCPARKREFLEHFISKKAFNIEGLGPKIIDQLANKNLVSRPEEIFELQVGDLLALDGFGQKSAQKLIQKIKQSKTIALPNFIFALGIRHIGETSAFDLAKRFQNIEKLQKAHLEELRDIPDIGEIGAQSIYQWFKKKSNIEFLKKLKELGIRILSFHQSGDKLTGKNFVITGSLSSISREEAQAKIRYLGGIVSSSINQNTDLLIVGKNPGSKLEKAKKLGKRIISEQQFLNMLKR